MKKRIKIKGRLRVYLQGSILLGIMLILVNLVIYLMDYRSGLMLTAALLLYFAVIFALMFYNKPIIMNELISFATQYGQIQKRLLREMEIPYALLDENGRVVWTNKAFEKVIHKEKGYHKSIATVFRIYQRTGFRGKKRKLR